MTQHATIPEDLDAFPRGTVVLDATGEVFRSGDHHSLPVWWHAGRRGPCQDVALPAKVIMDGAAA